MINKLAAVIGLVLAMGGAIYAAEDRYNQLETVEQMRGRIDRAESIQSLTAAENTLKWVRYEILLLEELTIITLFQKNDLDRLKRKERRLEEIIGY